MITVPSWGMHWMDGDIPVLIQADGVQHALDIDVEFCVRSAHRNPCPHAIDLAPAGVDRWRHLDHPLVERFLPRPKQPGDPLVFVENSAKNRIISLQLLRLSSATVSAIPIWMLTSARLAQQLELTNIQPLVLYGTLDRSNTMLQRVCEAATLSLRSVVYLGPSSTVIRPGMERLSTEDLNGDSLALLPLEATSSTGITAPCTRPRASRRSRRARRRCARPSPRSPRRTLAERRKSPYFPPARRPREESPYD